MQVYYEDASATLYLGDALESDVQCDLIVTDPPNNKEFVSGRAGGRWGGILLDDAPDDVIARLAHVLRRLRRGRHVYIFDGNLDLSSLNLSGFTELVWDKEIMGMGDLSSPWGPQHETIQFATHEISAANRRKGAGNLSARLRKGSVLRSTRPHSNGVKRHPTEKPVDILRQMIESSSMIGETVFDPFAGSGSTLVAAVLEGRKAVGVEVDERYAKVAATRLRNLPDVENSLAA